MDKEQLKYIVEAALMAAGRPLDLNALQGLFGAEHPPGKDDLRAAILALKEDYASRGISLQEVASGFRIQVRPTMSSWLTNLWQERTPRYSRALMETLAIIAYRQPVTRGDVEDIRGVGVTTNIMRSLLERSWIRVVGFRDVPGKPAMYGTTREFLDYFGLKKLDDLPSLADLKDLETMAAQLELADAEALPDGAGAPLKEMLAKTSSEEEMASEEGHNEDRLHDGSGASDSVTHAEDLATTVHIGVARDVVDGENFDKQHGDSEDSEMSHDRRSNVVPLKAR